MKLLRCLICLLPILTACGASATPDAPNADEESVSSQSDSLSYAPAKIRFGISTAAAKKGKTSTFVIETTHDLVLHSSLSCDSYDGQTVMIMAKDSDGRTLWGSSHLLDGQSVDVVFPVINTEIGRSVRAGTYTFDVVTADHTVIARGRATFVSNPAARPVSIPRLPIAGEQK